VATITFSEPDQELSVTGWFRAEHFGMKAIAEYDPTNQITAGFDLIPAAIARHPGQVIPLTGSWFGDAQDYLGMEVNVTIRKLGTLPEFEEEQWG